MSFVIYAEDKNRKDGVLEFVCSFGYNENKLLSLSVSYYTHRNKSTHPIPEYRDEKLPALMDRFSTRLT